MRKSFAIPAVLSAAVLAASVATSSPAQAATSTASGGKVFSFRGMNLLIPASWRVRRYGDAAVVATNMCNDPEYFYGDCTGFWVVGPKTLAQWGYTGRNRYVPTLAQPSCPFGGDTLTVLGSKASYRGLRPVGRGHDARYTTWPGYCEPQGSAGMKVKFTQREWYLPTSKILVVDIWGNKDLSGVLRRATWS
ncbi:hypothetical protein [Sphaerisporangium fuscum]|uniref:hypothetical protein n=1 Tax=Sphaerisporangium fuscum TaxID=2835868 RepID=UPI001BDD7B64|nr:hypothetical protein [Sphaerisporangium fuscum]